MNIEFAIKAITSKYGTMTGISEEDLKELFKEYIQKGCTVSHIYNICRLTLSLRYNMDDEMFTRADIAEMSGAPDKEIQDAIDRIREKEAQYKGNIYLFPEI